MIALSGGLDSVVLLMLFLQSGYKNIAIAHCNFQLRGEESDADEDFVRSLASELNIELFANSCDAAKYADDNKLTIQESARELRYSFFEEIALRESFDKIAIAHNADDQIETFFINLFRGSGTAGLKGMPLKRGKIIRPLLFASRQEIEIFASENKLKYREDSSNASDKYLRNKIRHHLSPIIEKISPQAKKSITSSLQYLQEDAMLLKQLINDKKEILFEHKGVNVIISMQALKKLNPLDVWLYYLLKDYGFSRKTTNDLTFVLQNTQISSCGKTFLSETHILLIDRNELILQQVVQETSKAEFLIQEGETEIKIPLHLQISLEENYSDFVFKSNPSTAYFNANRLKFPLTIRKWKQGDRFIPFGMKGSKLLSDYFIDNKIDRFTKDNIWLLLSGGEIIWIIGHRTSENFRVGVGCKRVLKVLNEV